MWLLGHLHGPLAWPLECPCCGAACGDSVLAGGAAPRSSCVSRVCPRLCASAPAPRPPSTILRSSGSRNSLCCPPPSLPSSLPTARQATPLPRPSSAPRAQEACPGSTRGALHPVTSRERWHHKNPLTRTHSRPGSCAPQASPGQVGLGLACSASPRETQQLPPGLPVTALCSRGQARLCLQRGGATRRTGLGSGQGPPEGRGWVSQWPEAPREHLG